MLWLDAEGATMKYTKQAENGYITFVGENSAGEAITADEYNAILEVIHAKPVAPDGYDYLLRTDLTWELCEVVDVEPEETEPTAGELLSIILEGVAI